MPISPQYTWTETEQALEVAVVLPGASRSKANVFATDCMLKINSAPYLLVLDLHDDVDDTASVATLTAEGVTFRLVKRKHDIWGKLEADGDKDALAKRRAASIDRAHARIEAARQERLERKKKEEKAAIDRQIELERKKRAEIDSKKKDELSQERTSLLEWQAKVKQQEQGDESDYEDEDEVAAASQEEAPMPDHPDYYGRGWTANRGTASTAAPAAAGQTSTATAVSSKPKHADADEHDDDDEASEGRWEQEQDGWAQVEAMGTALRVDEAAAAQKQQQQQQLTTFTPLPPPRITMEPVKVGFTKLELPHLPAREHREEEIRAYKKKVADDRLLADSVDVADRQPVFLKDKGDALYKQGNFRGAINAYSRAIELDDSMPLVWSNRAACHLQLNEAEAAAECCCRALELLKPRLDRLEEAGAASDGEAAVLRKQYVKVLVRRGQALAELSALPEALADYEAALKLDPCNAQLQGDLEELRAALAPADAAALRQRGNARFAAKDFEGARQAFSLLLGMSGAQVPEAERLAALSNRAACLLVLERYADAGADCDAALQLALYGDETQSLLAAALSDAASGTSSTTGGISGAVDGAGGSGVDGAAAAMIDLTVSSEAGCSSGALPEVTEQTLHDWAARQDSAEADVSSLQGALPAKLASIARILVRRGAVRGHMKQYQPAVQDYTTAGALLRAAGDGAKAAQLATDVGKLRELQRQYLQEQQQRQQ